MTYPGKVQDGVVVFDGDRPADGTAVTVGEAAEAVDRTESLSELLLRHSGSIEAGVFPTDSSVNVDHYLYGHPKRST